MSRFHLVIVADRHVLDSELLVTQLMIDGIAWSTRPEHLLKIDLRPVSLVLLDAACPDQIFQAACEAEAVGLLYETNDVLLRRRVDHPAVRLALPRSSRVQVLDRAVREVLQGTLCKALPRPRSAADAPLLSPRESEVLDLMARGLGNQAIAEVLDISPHTVRTHVRTVLVKLGKGNRASAVGAARVAGLLSR